MGLLMHEALNKFGGKVDVVISAIRFITENGDVTIVNQRDSDSFIQIQIPVRRLMEPLYGGRCLAKNFLFINNRPKVLGSELINRSERMRVGCRLILSAVLKCYALNDGHKRMRLSLIDGKRTG